jgi:hypothetical protein
MPFNDLQNTLLNKSLKRQQSVNPINVAIVGPCSASLLTLGTVYQGISASNVLPTLGMGKGAELAQFLLNSGLPSVDVYPTAPAASDNGVISGSVGLMVHTGSGTPTLTLALSTAVLDDYIIRAEVIALVTSGFVIRISYDDGISWAQTLTITSTTAQNLYVRLPNDTTNRVSAGLTITASVATGAVVGDVYTAWTFGPGIGVTAATAGMIPDAFNKLFNVGKKYTHILIACPNTGVLSTTTDATNITASSTLVNAVITQLALVRASGLYCEAWVPAPRQAALADECTSAAGLALQPAIVSGLLGSWNNRTAISYGYTLQQSLGSCNMWRPVFWSAMQRQIQQGPGVFVYRSSDGPVNMITPGQTPVAATSTGNVATVLTYTGILGTGSTFDERSDSLGTSTGYMSGNGFLTLTTIIEAPNPGSYYFANANAHCDPTDDYFELQYCLLMDIFMTLADQVLFANYKGQNLAHKQDGSGQLTANQATSIQDFFTQEMSLLMVEPGWIPPAQPGNSFADVDQTTNFVSTQKLSGKYGFWPPTGVKLFSNAFSLNL